MPQYIPSTFVLMLSLSALGCSPAPMDIIDYHATQTPRLTTAPMTETYSLMADERHVESTTLSAGDDVGFIREQGKLQAVAGDDRITLEKGDYSWVIEHPGTSVNLPGHWVLDSGETGRRALGSSILGSARALAYAAARAAH